MNPNTHEPWARLRELHIENFRGIDSLSLSLLTPKGQTASLLVLGGPNGAGKTSVLEACLIAVGAADQIRWGRGKEAVRQGADDYKITACFEIDGRLRWTEIGSAGQPRFGKVLGREYGPVKTPCVYFSSNRVPKFIGPIALPIAGKKGKKLKKPVAEEDRLEQIKIFVVAEKAFDAMTRETGFVDFGDNRTHTRYEDVIQQLDAAWQAFYPGDKRHFSAEPAGQGGTEGFDVFLKENEQRIPMDSLSSGQLEILNFAGWMLATQFNGGLVIIDEPELHLDPQWHSSVLSALRKLQPHSQFIIGTHSPRLFDSVMGFERAFLVPRGDPRAEGWIPVPDAMPGANDAEPPPAPEHGNNEGPRP